MKIACNWPNFLLLGYIYNSISTPASCYERVTDVKLLWSEHWVYLEAGDKELCQNSSSAVLKCPQ